MRRHVDGDDRARLIRRAAQRVGDVGAAAVRDDDHVVAPGRLHQRLHLLLVGGEDHHVGNPGDVAVLDGVHLGLGVAVPVAQALLRVLADLVRAQVLAHLLEEGLVADRRRDGGRVVGRVQVVGGDVRVDRLVDPAQEVGQLLARKLVAIAADADHVVVADEEAGVVEAPDVEGLGVFGGGLDGVGMDARRIRVEGFARTGSHGCGGSPPKTD